MYEHTVPYSHPTLGGDLLTEREMNLMKILV